MFDFGFSEMVLVGMVALIVLGPERLPKVARQAGQWLGKLQRYVADVKSDINRQMELDELRKLQGEIGSAARDLEDSLKTTISDTQAELASIEAGFDGNGSVAGEPATDWDKVYAQRRIRERIHERRLERDKELGHRRPKRRHR